MSRNRARRLFGTDGIRGRANVHPLTPEVALQLGRAVAHVFKGRSPRPRIVIGKDTRLSNYMFETALQAGICSMGVDAVQLGVLPTPGIAFMTTGLRADAGVVISASHNPFTDNGIKFFAGDGFKLPDETELKLEELLDLGDLDTYGVTGADVGRAYRLDDAVGRYCVSLKETLPRQLNLSGLKVVVDCGHGAAYRVAPDLFYELGADVVAIGCEPNGVNINEAAGALHPEQVAKAVLEHGADIGVALDGDADRIIVCDERGTIIDGDQILAILARDLMARQMLKRGTVVATVMSNLGLELALQAFGARLERTQVGDRYVVARMRAEGYSLGGEQSGHIVMLDHSTTGDGLLSALQLMRIMREQDMVLSRLAKVMTRLPQVLKNLPIARKPSLETLPVVSKEIERVRTELGTRGRVLVRYSGTEPTCRVMLEGECPDRLEVYASGIADRIDRVIGAA